MIEKTKNNITELVFILDKSGSMEGLERDTIGGFNSMIKRQKEIGGKVLVSTVLFSDRSEVIHDRVPIDKIKPMTGKDYWVDGCTALLDAVGGAIKHIGNVHKYARPEDVPANTMFVITTDGMENASRLYNSKQIKGMIERQKEKYGWEFLFVAANIDAIDAAGNIGIGKERAAGYMATPEGTEKLYSTISEVICEMRESAVIDDNWMNGLENNE